jgi:oligosaccharide repeat unit polymerase
VNPVAFAASLRMISRREKKLDQVFWLALLGAVGMASYVVTDATLALLSVLCVAASRVLVQKSCRVFVFRQTTITSFWYVTYLAMVFFPAFWVYADQTGPYRASFLFAVESVLITVPLGWMLANQIAGFQRRETEWFFRRPLAPFNIAHSLRRRYIVLLGIAIFLTILYFQDVNTIPLFYLFHHPGDYLVLANLRDDSLKLLDSPFTYFYYLTRGLVYPFLILVSFGCFLVTRTTRWARICGLTVCLGLFFASLSLAKSPVAAIFAMMGFFLYYYRGGKVSRRLVASFLICVFVFPVAVVLSVSYGMNVDFLDALRGIGARLFYLPSDIVYFYFEVFPSHVGYLHGQSIHALSLLLGRPYFNTAAYVGRYGFLEKVQSVIANGAFISDLNADFGLWGVLLGGVLTGCIMQAFHIYVVRREKTILTIACYSFLVFTFWLLNSTSLPIVLASNGAILVLFLTQWLETKRSVVVHGSIVRALPS